MRGVESGKMAR